MHPTPVIRVGELPWFSWVGAAGFLLSPFYLLSSGLPQPSDWLLFLFSTLVFIAGGLKFTFPVEARSILSWLLGLLAIIAVVNTTWTGLTGNLSMLKPVSYYIFNVLVTFSLVSYFHRVGFHVLRGVSYLIIATVLIQILLIPVVATGSLRQILFFNNPNQLAYFAVVCGSMVYAANVVFPIRKSILFAFIAACCVLAFLSVSRAGSIAMLTLIMLFFLQQPLVILFLGVGILGVLYGLEFQLENVDEVESRFRDLQADSDRGYHRVYQYPEYLILGVGEGMPSRFIPVSMNS